MPQPGTTVLPRIERRLAAILAADVARYSQLMGADEVGTLAALKAHRNERIDPVIARHHGRIVKTTGDGLLVEFASVVDAVACAVAIQRGARQAVTYVRRPRGTDGQEHRPCDRGVRTRPGRHRGAA
jgi:class 3 adenylate cyclase